MNFSVKMNSVYKCGLLGEKVDYSRSPEIFSHIFALEGIEGDCKTVNCTHAELGACLESMRNDSFNGLSVTIPHKEAIIPFLDEIDDVAGSLGSVNSILLYNGRTSGFNTDTFGFAQPLLPDAVRLKGKTALILGAGGAARSAAYSLAIDFELSELVLVGRNPRRLDQTLTRLSHALPRMEIRCIEWKNDGAIKISDLLSEGRVERASLIVNATPLGGPNQKIESQQSMFASIAKTVVYYDLNYNDNNGLVNAAREHGLRTLNGLPMLIHQALRSYYLWTGHQTPFSEIYARMGAHDS